MNIILLRNIGKGRTSNRHHVTLIEFKYMRQSSNCRKRMKQEAMHCLPGMVSARINV